MRTFILKPHTPKCKKIIERLIKKELEIAKLKLQFQREVKQLIAQMARDYEDGMSTTELTRKYNIKNRVLQDWLTEAGVALRRTGWKRKC